jgi:anthranilate synthase component 1
VRSYYNGRQRIEQVGLTVSLGWDVDDARLGQELLSSEKDRAEHIMLVDLARNDVNRVCKPETVKVDDLMRLEKFSHVIHLTSQISGTLREDKSRWVFVNRY